MCPIGSVGYSALHGMTVEEAISLDKLSLPLMLRMEYLSPEMHALLQDDGNVMIKRKPNEVSFLLGGGALHAHPQTTSTPP